MNARLVVCFALVAMTAFGTVHGDTSLNASASLDVSLSKGEALAAAAQANPSAPPDESTTLLSAHKMDIGVNITKTKQPLLTVAEAPCKNVCHDKCDFKLEKHCLTVDVPKKECTMIKKTIAKQHCEKRCKPTVKLSLPDLLIPKLPTKTDSTNPNPSAPPAALDSSTLPLPEKQLGMDLSVSKSVDMSLSAVGKQRDLSLSADANKSLGLSLDDSDKGRRLQGLPLVAAAAAVATAAHHPVAAAAVATAAHHSVAAAAVATAAHLAHKVDKPELDLNCQDVCVDASYVVPELQCTESTQQVEKCTVVPEKVCEKECVCIPQKTITLNKLSKPSINLSVEKKQQTER